MGLLTALRRGSNDPAPAKAAHLPSRAQVHASLADVSFPDLQTNGLFGGVHVNRNEAMQVPAVARSRNILAGVIAELPLQVQREDGSRIHPAPWLSQPDPDQARSVTLAWTLDDLLFYGRSAWQVIESYADDGRPARFRRILPHRLGWDTDSTGFLITRWKVDGEIVPKTGPGALVVIEGLEEGVLLRGGRTIRTAIELERAALRYAEEPAPSVVLRNKGGPLPSSRVDDLLAKWRASRQTSGTGYLNENVDLEQLGYDAVQAGLKDSREHSTGEIARLVGLPAWFIGAAQSAGSMTYGNVTQERRSLIDFSLRPFLSAIEQRLSMVDVTRNGQLVRFNLTEFLRSDPMSMAQLIAVLVKQKVIEPHEAREWVDLTPRGSND